jgi:hypothetical protein
MGVEKMRIHGINTHTPAPKKPVSRETKRRMWAVMGLTVVLLLLYFTVSSLAETGYIPVVCGEICMAVYMVAFAGLLVGYLVYNRAFVNKNVTVDTLPDDWSQEKKQAFVDDNRARAEKSRWLLTFIIPFIFVFMAEALYLFLWSDNLELLFK